MYIAIDFDGTIVDHRFPDIGPPVPDAITWMKAFQEEGAKLILFTMRSDGDSNGPVLQQAVDYLKSEGIELFGVNHNPTQSSWTTSPKAYAQLYIDDAAVGCPMIDLAKFYRPCVDWSVVGPNVLERIIEGKR